MNRWFRVSISCGTAVTTRTTRRPMKYMHLLACESREVNIVINVTDE